MKKAKLNFWRWLWFHEASLRGSWPGENLLVVIGGFFIYSVKIMLKMRQSTEKSVTQTMYFYLEK